MANFLSESFRITKAYAAKYFPNAVSETPNDSRAVYWLKADIEEMILKHGDEAREFAMNLINASPCKKEILDVVGFPEIDRAVTIRKDFRAAFDNVESGSDLAHDISYGLSKRDVEQLAKLHKKNICRRKIEELLECVNFHEECSDFIEKKYDKYIAA